MEKFRVLIVDDDPDNTGPLLTRLDSAKFDTDLRSTAETALAKAAEGPLDVVFIDLELTESKLPVFEGIPLGEGIRKHQTDATIVMYSGHIVKGEVEKFAHHKDCIEAGADVVISKTELFSIGAEKLETLVRQWIQKRREETSSRLHVTFAKNLHTKALLEAFDRSVLDYLISECVFPKKHFTVEAVEAGYSGAALVRVAASHDEKFAAPTKLIVKLAHSQFGLENELQRRPIPGSLLGSRSVTPHPQHIHERDGVYAIAIAEVRGRMLLRDFLRLDGVAGEETEVLKRCVRDLLVQPAREAQPWEEFDVDSRVYRFKAMAGCEILDFMSQAECWDAVLRKSDLASVQTSKTFIHRMLEGQWDFTVDGRYAALLHGDFHCRNVFVATTESPVLIDFGRADVYPRLFDFAALHVDLVLSLLDCENGEDQQFERIERWVESITSQYPFSASPTVAKMSTREAFLLQTLAEEMISALDGVVASEYGEVLVFHLLRYLRFSNITAAKKILALRLIERLVQQLGLV